MKKILFLILFLFISCIARLPVDSAMSAIDGLDKTALVEACGNQLVPGYTYCRKTEGTTTDEFINFIAPPAQCKQYPCVILKVFFPDNSQETYAYEFRKGEIVHKVAWKEILDRDIFSIDDRGFWPFMYKIKWVDQDGRERTSITEGEIRLRVLKKRYEALNDAQDNENFVWKYKYKNVQIKMTSSGRTFVSTAVN